MQPIVSRYCCFVSEGYILQLETSVKHLKKKWHFRELTRYIKLLLNILACEFCQRADDRPEKYGERRTYEDYNLTVHYYCVVSIFFWTCKILSTLLQWKATPPWGVVWSARVEHVYVVVCSNVFSQVESYHFYNLPVIHSFIVVNVKWDLAERWRRRRFLWVFTWGHPKRN